MESASDDPDVWLTKIELIRMQLIKFKAAVSDDDLITHVINNLPSDYNQLIDTMEYMMNKDELDLNNMREMLNLAFSRMNPGGNVEEKALAAKHYTKQFKKIAEFVVSKDTKMKTVGKKKKISINVRQIGKVEVLPGKRRRIIQVQRRNSKVNAIIARNPGIKKTSVARKSRKQQMLLTKKKNST